MNTLFSKLVVKKFPRAMRSSARAFTLVELIAVITIIAIIVAAALPQFFGVLRATKLTSAGDLVLGRVLQAQQTALAMSSPVELRFYEYTPSGEVETRDYVRAMQLVDPEYQETPDAPITPRAISEPILLPPGVVISPSSTLSPLLESALNGSDDLFQAYRSAKYYALHFYPDGSFRRIATKQTSGATGGTGAVTPALVSSFLTIVGEQEVGENEPKNFACIQLDPYTSKARLYRPEADF